MWCGVVQTPFSTFRKAHLTDELVDFAVQEFNHYPNFLRAHRNRPPYIPPDRVWPPLWVNETGRDGPMHLDRKGFIKHICILYLLGVKGLATANLDDLFSRDPIMREEWLCKITTRRDIRRFIRQVQPNTQTHISCTMRNRYSAPVLHFPLVDAFKTNFFCWQGNSRLAARWRLLICLPMGLDGSY